MRKAFLLFLIFILVFSFSSCSDDIPDNQSELLLYFSDPDEMSLHPEIIYAEENLSDDALKFASTVLNKLLEGPADPEHIAVIPDDVYVRGISMNDEKGIINVDLGGSYYPNDNRESAANELLARYSIVKTLCQCEQITGVKFYVNGLDMKSAGGKGEILTPIRGENILINSPSSVETQTEKFVTLYFASEDGKYLKGETRKATMTDNSLENTVVTELLRGPSDDKLKRIIPEGVTLISIETAEEVCFVNLSSEFLRLSDSQKIRQAVYSVVNSLTELEEIDKVQILVEGKKPEDDKEQLFSAPLVRNEKIIKEK